MYSTTIYPKYRLIFQNNWSQKYTDFNLKNNFVAKNIREKIKRKQELFLIVIKNHMQVRSTSA